MLRLSDGLSVSALPEKSLVRQANDVASAYCLKLMYRFCAQSVPISPANSVFLCRYQLTDYFVALVQESVASKVHSESRLHAFTKKLRHAILHNADVASVWQPAAHVLDIKATLDRKLKDQSFASAATQVAGCNASTLRRSTLC